MDAVSVQVAYPGAVPVEVERGILLAIEEQVRSIDGVKRVESSASEGSGQVMIELETRSYDLERTKLSLLREMGRDIYSVIE